MEMIRIVIEEKEITTIEQHLIKVLDQKYDQKELHLLDHNEFIEIMFNALDQVNIIIDY